MLNVAQCIDSLLNLAIHYALEDHLHTSQFMQDGTHLYLTPSLFGSLSRYLNDCLISLDYDIHTRGGMD